MFKEAADIKTSDQLHLPVPDAKFETVVVKPSEIQQDMVQALSERAAEVHSGSVDPSVDNMLKITSDGRKIGLDQRLMNSALPDDPNSKLNACVNNVLRIWNDTKEQKLTQLIFCDMSTPKGDGSFNVYEGYGAKRICNYLVEHNIMGRNGKNIPNITIGRMIRNKGYTGYLINGNVEKECPELRIIEPEVFEKAQELRDARRREKGEDADSYSPHALLCGKVFCAHCGNRLNITSSGRTRLRADGTVVKEKRYRYSCNFNVRHPGQCDGQSGYGVTTLDAVVESIVCMKFEEILECSKSNLLEEMRRKDLDAAKKEATRWKEEVQTKVDEQDALKKEMIRVIQGTSGLDREMIQQMVNENKEALLTAQTNLADSEKKLKEIEEQNQKAERNCSDLFTWASTYKGASFERRQAILKQFIKEVRVGRDYNIEIVLNVPLDEFEEFKRHAASAGRGKNQKNKSQNPQKVGRCTSNAGIVVLDKTAGETISIVPKNAAHAILRC